MNYCSAHYFILIILSLLPLACISPGMDPSDVFEGYSVSGLVGTSKYLFDNRGQIKGKTSILVSDGFTVYLNIGKLTIDSSATINGKYTFNGLRSGTYFRIMARNPTGDEFDLTGIYMLSDIMLRDTIMISGSDRKIWIVSDLNDTPVHFNIIATASDTVIADIMTMDLKVVRRLYYRPVDEGSTYIIEWDKKFYNGITSGRGTYWFYVSYVNNKDQSRCALLIIDNSNYQEELFL